MVQSAPRLGTKKAVGLRSDRPVRCNAANPTESDQRGATSQAPEKPKAPKQTKVVCDRTVQYTYRKKEQRKKLEKVEVGEVSASGQTDAVIH
jgi:hypothetical protein